MEASEALIRASRYVNVDPSVNVTEKIKAAFERFADSETGELQCEESKLPRRGFCTSRTRIWGRTLGCEFLSPEFWGPKFFAPNFASEKSPLFSLKKFTALNSRQKLQYGILAEEFTLQFCRAMSLISYLAFSFFGAGVPDTLVSSS